MNQNYANSVYSQNSHKLLFANILQRMVFHFSQKTRSFLSLKCMHSVYSSDYPECSNITLHYITLHYITLHYITLPWYCATCTVYNYLYVYVSTVPPAALFTHLEVRLEVCMAEVSSISYSCHSCF